MGASVKSIKKHEFWKGIKKIIYTNQAGGTVSDTFCFTLHKSNCYKKLFLSKKICQSMQSSCFDFSILTCLTNRNHCRPTSGCSHTKTSILAREVKSGLEIRHFEKNETIQEKLKTRECIPKHSYEVKNNDMSFKNESTWYLNGTSRCLLYILLKQSDLDGVLVNQSNQASQLKTQANI